MLGLFSVAMLTKYRSGCTHHSGRRQEVEFAFDGAGSLASPSQETFGSRIRLQGVAPFVVYRQHRKKLASIKWTNSLDVRGLFRCGIPPECVACRRMPATRFRLFGHSPLRDSKWTRVAVPMPSSWAHHSITVMSPTWQNHGTVLVGIMEKQSYYDAVIWDTTDDGVSPGKWRRRPRRFQAMLGP